MKHVIYDLDETSLYCPLAYKLDKCHKLKQLLPKPIFYSLYTPVYIIELMFRLFKVNRNMRVRAILFHENADITQHVVTARHSTLITKLHKYLVFKEMSKYISLHCVASGKTEIDKATYVYRHILFRVNDKLLIFENDPKEISSYNKYFFGKVAIVHTNFNGEEERCL